MAIRIFATAEEAAMAEEVGVVTVVTEQQQKCLRGEHEADSLDQSGLTVTRYTREDVADVIRDKTVFVCKHCRCLYVEKG